MDDNKAFCVICLNLVDPQTHHDCTLTFDNLLADDESVGAENFQQNIGAATGENPQIHNSGMLEGGIKDKSLLKRKSDFANHKLPVQNPTNGIATNMNPTSLPVLEAHRPAVQPAGSTDNENGYFYGVAQAYYPINHLYSQYNIGQQLGQTAIGSVQHQNEFQNTRPEDNARNRLNQEYPQSSYGQHFASNALSPHTVPAFSAAFPKAGHNNSMIAYAHMNYHPYLNYQHPQNPSASNEPQTNMESPSNNKGSENYALNLKTSPISPELNGEFGSVNIIMNKEMDLNAQNKISTNCLVSKSEIPSKNGVDVNKMTNRFAKNYSQRNRRKTADKSTLQKNTEISAHQKKEMWSTPQRIVKRGTPQNEIEGSEDHKNEKSGTQPKKMEQSLPQKHEMKSLSEKHSIKNVLQKNAEASLQENGTKKGAHIQDVEKGVHVTDAEKGAQATDEQKNLHATDTDKGAHAVNADKGAHAANAEKGTPTENAENTPAANAEKGTHATDEEKDTHATDEEKGTNATAEEKSAHATNEERNAHATDAEREQENARVFTGEGYKSIEEFIEALYNGTLYKRY